MDAETLEKFKQAGEIAAAARKHGASLVKAGVPYVEVGEAVEDFIRTKGAAPAFPSNISVNNVAAHDIPAYGDARLFNEGDVVKLDVGAHVDGYVCDTATTVIVGSNPLAEQMKRANDAALEKATQMMTPGTAVVDVSRIIEETIKKAGFKVVINLTGHGVGRYVVHTSPAIPNVPTATKYALKEGDVVAIEPFVTTGAGSVNETEGTQIYMWTADRPIRLPEGRKILDITKNRYGKLPFAKRWLVKDAAVTPVKLEMVVKQLVGVGALYEYPPLREAAGALVTQAEHTVVVGEKPLVLTA